jgi:UDP-N-acetylmuramoyl-L-alanyl-D-glutamate--2,6-diaminopimelate ligase
MSTSLRRLTDAVPADLVVGLIGVPSGGRDADEIDVVDLTHDSRAVSPGWAFACVPGAAHDGHDYADAAVEAGAVLLIVDRPLPAAAPQLVVSDVRAAMGFAAAEVHGRPADGLRLVGITGTNGKTTATKLVGAIADAAGLRHREHGTLSGARTTPESPDLQRRLAGDLADGVELVVMEVSSHALTLHRVDGCRFDVVAFTNLSQDHLDLHVTMEAYFRAKASLFVPGLAECGVTNLDDRYGRLLLDAADIPMTGFSVDDVTEVEVGLAHHRFTWHGVRFEVPLGGRFNLENTLCALAVADRLGIDAETAARGLRTLDPVPGRYEIATDPGHPFTVIVDYAHTPDGLVELFSSVRDDAGAGRVIGVFGCGGDRDRDKRPAMGAAVAEHADLVVVTSDNPRHEDPSAIIDDALAGIAERDRNRVTVEVDRRAGIAAALEMAQPGDVVVVAGKGHEATQTIGDTASPFDDRTVVRELLMNTPPASVQPPCMSNGAST